MAKYYWAIICEVFQSLQRLRGATLLILTIVIAALFWFNEPIGNSFLVNYNAISPKWALVALGIAAAWTFLKVNYEHVATIEKERNSLREENERLKTPLIDIEYNDVAPYRDVVENIDLFRLAIKNKSRTQDVKSVNLWLVDIENVRGWNHNHAEQLLRQYEDSPSDGVPFARDATLSPDQSQFYDFISRWRDHERPIAISYARAVVDTIPSGQYKITVKATASNSRPRYCKFLVQIDGSNRLEMMSFGSFVKN